MKFYTAQRTPYWPYPRMCRLNHQAVQHFILSLAAEKVLGERPSYLRDYPQYKVWKQRFRAYKAQVEAEDYPINP